MQAFFTETQKFGTRMVRDVLTHFQCDKIFAMQDDCELEHDDMLHQLATCVLEESNNSYGFEYTHIGDVNKVSIDRSGVVQNNSTYSHKIISKMTFIANVSNETLELCVHSGIEEDNHILLEMGCLVLIPSYYSWETKNENVVSFVVGNFMGEAFR